MCRSPRKFVSALFAIALSMAVVPLTATAVDTPLPTHPDLTFGTLDNGLSFILKNHTTPPGRVGIFLLIDTGSLNETDAQQGLAHFLEHMAFNGTENFPPGELIPFFEKLGLQFGQHQNASTGFDRTLYILDLPKNDLETVNNGLLCLSDMAFRMLLLEDEINKERGIVQGELRSRLGPDMRIIKEIWPKLMPGALLPNRWPIGTEEVIMSAPQEEFVDYYNTWYRPENMTLFVVGDVDIEAVKPLISQHFNESARQPAREPQHANITPYETSMAVVATDPEKVGADVELLYFGPAKSGLDTVEEFRQQQVETIVSFAMNRRLANLIAEGNAPFRSASLAIQPLFGETTIAFCEAESDPEDWDPSMRTIAREVRRAFEFGFNEQEIADARKQMLASAQAMVQMEPTMDSRPLIQMMAEMVNSEATLMSAQQRLNLVEAQLPGISVADIHACFQEYFNPERFAWVVTMPEPNANPEPGEVVVIPPTEVEVMALVRSVAAEEVTPYEVEERPEVLLAKLPRAGKTSITEVADDLEVTSHTLSNGVRVHYKFNNLQENQVSVTISVAGGHIEEGVFNRGITSAAVTALNQAATSTLKSTHIKNLMTGKNVGVRAISDRDCVTLMVSGTPDDLESGLQLAHLLLTDPEVEESAFNNWKDATLQEIEQREFNVMQQLIGALGPARTNDVRFASITEKQVNGIERDQVKRWIRRIFRSNPIEVAVVGDMAHDEVMALVNQYVGSLGKRSSDISRFNVLRKIMPKKGPQTITVDFISQEDKALGFAAFRGADAVNLTDKRHLKLAAMVLSTRMHQEIREERQLVYSVAAQSSAAETYPDLGLFYAFGTECDPANVDLLISVASDMMRDFADHGPTEEELNVARGQVLSELDTQMKGPGYWTGMLSHLDYRGRTLDEIRSEISFYETVTSETVQATFVEYCTPERQINIRVVPRREDEN